MESRASIRARAEQSKPFLLFSESRVGAALTFSCAPDPVLLLARSEANWATVESKMEKPQLRRSLLKIIDVSHNF